MLMDSARAVIRRMGVSRGRRLAWARSAGRTVVSALAVSLVSSSVLAQVSPETLCKDAIQDVSPLGERLAALAGVYQDNGRWRFSDIERLCKGTALFDQPGVCFAEAITSEDPWSSGQSARWDLAIDLCAGTNDARETVDCFLAAKTSSGSPGQFTRIDRWQKAAKKCARWQNAGLISRVGSASGARPSGGTASATGSGTWTSQADPSVAALTRKIEELERTVNRQQATIDARSRPAIVVPKDLAADVEALKKQVFVTGELPFQDYSRLSQGDVSPQVELKVDKAGDYSVIGLCGSNCAELRLTLFDQFNNRLGADSLGANKATRPVIALKAQAGSQFGVTVQMLKCTGKCDVAVILLDRPAVDVATVALFAAATKPATTTAGIGSGSSSSSSGASSATSTTTGSTATTVSVGKPAHMSESEYCATFVKDQVSFDYAGTKWANPDLATLCNGTPNALEPARCYYRMMHETGPHKDKPGDWGPQFALDLCAKTGNATARIACFDTMLDTEAKYRPKNKKARPQAAVGPDRWKLATGVCAVPTSASQATINPVVRTGPEEIAYAKPGFVEVKECRDSIQGKVAFEFLASNKIWDPTTLDALCRGTKKGSEPRDCFVSATSSGILNPAWGSPQAVELCTGTSAARVRVACLLGNAAAIGRSGTPAALAAAIQRCARD